MNRTKLNHEVGSVYRKSTYAGENFDDEFMSTIIDGVVGILGIFVLCFALVIVL
jgi:hypothetical protein